MMLKDIDSRLVERVCRVCRRCRLYSSRVLGSRLQRGGLRVPGCLCGCGISRGKSCRVVDARLESAGKETARRMRPYRRLADAGFYYHEDLVRDLELSDDRYRKGHRKWFRRLSRFLPLRLLSSRYEAR